jgi:hypothetical protein
MSINRGVEKENLVTIYNVALFYIYKEEKDLFVCKKIDGTEDHLVQRKKLDSGRQK